jgi:hypothetical protein
MKAIVYHNSGSGDVLRLQEIEKPVPEDDEVLIKVRAASVNPLDYHLLRHAFLRRIISARSKVKIAQAGRDVAAKSKLSAGTLYTSKRATRCLERAIGPLPSMRAHVSQHWQASRPMCCSSKRLLCLWRDSPPCRVCATRDRFSRARRS